MTVDVAKVRRLLGGEDVAWLVARARDRWSRGQPLGETVRLAEPTPGERDAMAALLGRRAGTSGPLTVRVADVEAVLGRAGAAPDLRSAVTALTGPVCDVAAQRAGEQAAWAAAHGSLEELSVTRPVLAVWVRRVRATGLLRRLEASPQEASTLAARAALVVAALPVATRELRGHLANRLLQDAHALDDGGKLATLVLGAAAELGGHDAGDAEARGGAWRRRVWSSVGVAVGDLAAPVLTLGLPGDAGSATGRALGVWREAGEPVHLTLRQLTVDPPRLPLVGRDVFVCENPSVVERAADELAADCLPLVCTHGQPSAAVAALLDLVDAAGGRLHHHGDFDWGGLRIAGRVLGTWRAEPWRLRASDYDAAVARGLGGRPLGPSPAESPWDPALAARMAEAGRAVEEEALADVLLADLTGDGGGRREISR